MHRVPGHSGACRAFHGHRYVATITCGGAIPDSGMVVDFGVVKALVGRWIDAHWDHTAILWRDDPEPAVEAISTANHRYGKPVYFMDHPPTAENLAAELAQVASELLGPRGVSVTRVEIAETPNSLATWTAAGPTPSEASATAAGAQCRTRLKATPTTWR
jgi:6-pyruvoyltetrahydropterin/6-carboxytetrahydropterin synthase